MPSEVRFAEVRKLLEDHGYTLSRIKGSHHWFERPGARGISVPVHKGRVQPRYLAIIRKALEAR